MMLKQLATFVLCASVLGRPAAVFGGDETGFAEMTNRVDRLLAESWANAGLSPAARSSDSEFLRRLSLDLTGTIPTVGEVRAFLNEGAPDKRERLIDVLPARPYFTRPWN